VGDRKASSEMIGHYGPNAKLPCHMCRVPKMDLNNHALDLNELRRNFEETKQEMLNIRSTFLIKGKKTEAKFKEQQISLHCRKVLHPIWWLEHFNPLYQSPLCWMHNHPLGLLKRILLNFAAIYSAKKSGKRSSRQSSFASNINSSTISYPTFR